MNKWITTLIALVLLLVIAAPSQTEAASSPPPIPTFSIISINPDTNITIKTFNIPAGYKFDILMGYMGTRGVNGIKVATFYSGIGGSFTKTVSIPSALKGQYQIAVRLQSHSGGYYAYNWFYNSPGGAVGPGPGPAPVPTPNNTPTFSIFKVVTDTSVSIQTNNFPKNDNFNVLMNYMGTRGVNGIKVDNVNSGKGGILAFTFNIPDALRGQYQIAIRLESSTGSKYYAYNWFYNNPNGIPGGSGSPPPPGYSGYPTFSITSVVRDTKVTISTYNLPPNNTFQVLMGPKGTRGINGYLVDTIDSGKGGNQKLTFNIHPALNGNNQISIRIQSISGSGYYAYNWFYNNTTPY